MPETYYSPYGGVSPFGGGIDTPYGDRDRRITPQNVAMTRGGVESRKVPNWYPFYMLAQLLSPLSAGAGYAAQGIDLWRLGSGNGRVGREVELRDPHPTFGSSSNAGFYTESPAGFGAGLEAWNRPMSTTGGEGLNMDPSMSMHEWMSNPIESDQVQQEMAMGSSPGLSPAYQYLMSQAASQPAPPSYYPGGNEIPAPFSMMPTSFPGF